MSRLYRLKRKQHRRQGRINTALKQKLFLSKGVFISYCCYCKLVYLTKDLTIEHLTPLSMGGTNEEANISLACETCNQQKGREAWFFKKERNHEQYTAQHLR